MQQHWTGGRGKNNPCPPGLHHPEREEDSSGSNTDTTCQEGPLRNFYGGPLQTLTKLSKNTTACLLLKYIADNVRKTNFSCTGQNILSHLSCTQRKWELDKENPCLMPSTEHWPTPNPGTWHPNKLNPLRRRMGNERGSLRGSSPDQTCLHRWTAGWLSGLWWSSPWLSYSGEVTEMRERYRESIPTVIPSQSENIAKWSAFSWGHVWCQDEQDDAWQQGFGDPCSSLDDSMWQQPCLQGAKVGAGDRSKTLHTISQWTRTCLKDNWMYV